MVGCEPTKKIILCGLCDLSYEKACQGGPTRWPGLGDLSDAHSPIRTRRRPSRPGAGGGPVTGRRCTLWFELRGSENATQSPGRGRDRFPQHSTPHVAA
jgi:hypothetical protein